MTPSRQAVAELELLRAIAEAAEEFTDAYRVAGHDMSTSAGEALAVGAHLYGLSRKLRDLLHQWRSEQLDEEIDEPGGGRDRDGHEQGEGPHP